ncbi:His-Xaa-Ser system radical SAM maturase HxsC [Sphingomonas suaedae]|uniref:His-Xaa-Ser system radical SAM maturase HxsC n=1 Tax=Sphingomonas suaedae TaxID=2599297 RepID=A0A518RHT5_9SPHN|nr:His-Xaa-Ser system radical SAM maturase HxsC [Sphingomonas suaedae]QDX27002.1 His-Xaa-Ser system radical SAM maturase HxsC [Sphingomonas suaedae]
MIALALPAQSDARAPFVTRLAATRSDRTTDSFCLSSSAEHSLWCGANGLMEIAHPRAALLGDIVLVDPAARRVERLIRATSRHNTLLVTERCDQLCVMCSQPPRKTHVDRFDLLTQACLLAPHGMTIGISGGEPTLYLPQLLALVETVRAARDDVQFHILSNGQHFTQAHVERLRSPVYRGVTWGIPLYAAQPYDHDSIVGKQGAYDRLEQSLVHLLRAGARIELRTVVTRDTLPGLLSLARAVTLNLAHIEQWSIMGLENIGFARQRWDALQVDLRTGFAPLAAAIDRAILHGVPVRLFNMPLCQVPPAYRHLAVASISDWKQRFAKACDGCSAKPDCSGFFEWHPDILVEEVTPL